MGDENPIRTLGDYSKPSHEGYRNTIELPKNNSSTKGQAGKENVTPKPLIDPREPMIRDEGRARIKGSV
ncbi:hypothetical protein Tco_1327810 [Tanacetum coccineum]